MIRQKKNCSFFLTSLVFSLFSFNSGLQTSLNNDLFSEEEINQLGVHLYDLQCEDTTYNLYLYNLSNVDAEKWSGAAILLPDSVIDAISPSPTCDVNRIKQVVDSASLLFEKIVISNSRIVEQNRLYMEEYVSFADKMAKHLIKKPHNNNEEDVYRYVPILPKQTLRCNQRIIQLDKQRIDYYSIQNGYSERTVRSVWSTMGRWLFDSAVQKLNNAVVGRFFKWYTIRHAPGPALKSVGGLIAFEAFAIAANAYPRYKLKENACFSDALRHEYCTNINSKKVQFKKMFDDYNNCQELVKTYTTLPDLKNP